jgi:hypothetical protein
MLDLGPSVNVGIANGEGGGMQDIVFLWKDGNSGGGGCPALYQAPGGYVVQGKLLDTATRAQLRQLADDEDAVFVPANVLERLRHLP